MIVIQDLKEITPEFVSILSELSDVNLSIEEAEEVFKLRPTPPYYTVVAIHDSKIIGTATLFIEQKYIHRGKKVGHVEDVVVAKEYRGQGVARMMEENLASKAKAKGCYKIILDCFENLVPLYQKLGYRKFNVGMRKDL